MQFYKILFVLLALVFLAQGCSNCANNNTTSPANNSAEILKPQGVAFLDSIEKKFSCASVQYSKTIRKIENKDYRILSIQVSDCSGDLAFDSVYQYIDMPELISTRLYQELVSPEKFNQIEFSCKSNKLKKAVFTLFYIDNKELKYLQTYEETMH